MPRFLARRLILIPLALLLVHFFGFAYAHLAGAIHASRGPYALVGDEPVPLLPAYTDYLVDTLHLELGPMPGRPESLSRGIYNATIASLGLLGLALVLSVGVGSALGLLAVRSNPPEVSRWLAYLATVGLAMPGFYVGSLFILGLVFFVVWGFGRVPLPSQGFGWDSHLVLPTLALMLRPTVQIAQVTATLLAGELKQQYVVASRSLGFPWRVVRWKHALRNVLAPVLLTVLNAFRWLVGEAIIIEWLFGWPGVGRLLAQALIASGFSSPGAHASPTFLHPPLLAALLVVFAGLLLAADSLVSALVRQADPRLRIADGEAAHA